MLAVVYHWKHGWIPLDHAAALSKAKGDEKSATSMMQGVRRDHLSRSPHITAVAKGSRVVLQDKHTGHTIGIDAGHAASFHNQGHTITAVNNAGSFTTRNDYGQVNTYGRDGRKLDSGADTRLSQNQAAFPTGSRVSFREGRGPLAHGTVIGHTHSGIQVKRDEGGVVTRVVDDLGHSHKRAG